MLDKTRRDEVYVDAHHFADKFSTLLSLENPSLSGFIVAKKQLFNTVSVMSLRGSSLSFYRARLRTARYRLPRQVVCLSVTVKYCDHIGWISSKIISPLNISLGFLISADPNITSTPKGTFPHFSRNRSGVWKNWLWAYKTGNISETVEDRAKVTIKAYGQI